MPSNNLTVHEQPVNIYIYPTSSRELSVFWLQLVTWITKTPTTTSVATDKSQSGKADMVVSAVYSESILLLQIL